MKARNVLVITLALAFLAAGCGQEEGDELDQLGYNLEIENGGFTLGQAMPVLPVEELADEDVQVMAYVDDDAEEATAENAVPAGRPVYMLRVVWGQFPFNRQLSEWTHWRGVVQAEGAKVFVARAAFYERHDFFAPCPDRSCVNIDSRTLPHHDGLVLKIVPQDTDPATPLRVTIAFDGLYVRELGPLQLSGLTEVSVVDDMANKVVLNSFARPACPAGAIAGLWKRLNRRGGVFAGDWLNVEGLKVGKLAGIWGQRRNGERVFFGVYASAQGEFLGLVKGKYRPLPRILGPGEGGAFAGRWISKTGEVGGVLRGIYNDNPDAVRGLGHFRGRFQAACNAEPRPSADDADLDAALDDCGCEVDAAGAENCGCAG